MELLPTVKALNENFFSLFDSDTESDQELDTPIRSPPVRLDFWDDIVPVYTDDEFKDHFRMNWTTFNSLCDDISPLYEYSANSDDETEIHVTKQVAVALLYLGSQETLSSISERVGFSKSTCWYVVNNFAQRLIQLNVDKLIIDLPSAAEKGITSRYFQRTHRIKGVIGIIDVSHIPIATPLEHPNSYICKNGFPSVVLQACCNEKMEFIQTYVGELGSVHSSQVLLRSKLHNKIESGDIEIKANEHLVGSSAYPLRSWLMTPYTDYENLSELEAYYNIGLTVCRRIIQRAFTLLKERFRRLKQIEINKVSIISVYVGACCILHNYCIKNNDQYDIDLDEKIDEVESTVYPVFEDDYVDEAAVRKRDDIIKIF